MKHKLTTNSGTSKHIIKTGGLNYKDLAWIYDIDLKPTWRDRLDSLLFNIKIWWCNRGR